MPKGHPVDYAVPNFGQDEDVISSAGSISLAEDQLKHKWEPKLKKDMPDLHPINYPVANLGVDTSESGIDDTRKSIAQAERQLGVNWIAQTKKPKEHPVDYSVANFGMDEDISSSLSHLNQMEKKYGTWDLPKEDE